jgi:tetratricopeptide (TPR) repeat protein
MVSSVPFFTTKKGPLLSDSLIILVFNQKALAEATLPGLYSDILSTETSVTVTTGVIVAGCFGFVLLLVIVVVIRITSPLEALREISLEVLQMSSEDESQRDYSKIILHPVFIRSTISLSDEIGALTNDYFQVVCRMNNTIERKKSTPAYPENPFHLPQVKTWDTFYSKLFSTVSLAKPFPITQDSLTAVTPLEEDELDVLGSLGAGGGRKYVPVVPEVPFTVNLDDTETGSKHSSNPYAEVLAEASAYQQAHAPSSTKIVDSGSRTTVSFLTSIKSLFYFLALLIILSSLVVCIITVLTLRDNGQYWMDSTRQDLYVKQMTNLASIAMVKGVFVKHFFLQIFVDIKVTGSYITNIVNGEYLNPVEYLKSYSLDPNSAHASPFHSSNSYSGYFKADQTYSYHNSSMTRNSSLFDIKYQSLIYEESLLVLAQFGVENDGYFRHYPYSREKTWSTNPPKCYVQSTEDPICLLKYQNSGCSVLGANYSEYDPRCRSWYQFAKKEAVDENEAYIMYPRFQSSTNEYVVTSVMKIMRGSEFLGVINSNSYVEFLSNAVNQLKILENGYSYIVDARNSTYVIMHPSSSCGQVLCAERFSDKEFATFYDTVLLPLQQNALSGSSQTIMSSYIKGGKEWRLSYSYVKVSSIYYAVISTVPYDDIDAGSQHVVSAIGVTINSIIAAFVVCITVVAVFLNYFTMILIRVTVDPINELRCIASLLATGDLNSTIPKESSSLDMRVLLDAFSKLVVAIRFGNDNLARGNLIIARGVYIEALNLFTNTGNIKGLGACHNNLGAVELASGKFVEAENHYNTAIEYCKEAILKAVSPEEKARLRRTLSNRRGNLAVLYLERTDMPPSKFKFAFDLLEELLLEDKKM